MDAYTDVSYQLSEQLTKRYSTSFSLSSSLFDRELRKHIYAIYGMVRIADEIVDTYRGNHAAAELEAFEKLTYDAVDKRFSTNPLLHAFAQTAATFDIDKSLISPFFDSMRMDLTYTSFTESEYNSYIYGSAEVIGLMCLKVFVHGDKKKYDQLTNGARALGSAYQKVNFLRDFRADHENLGRCYFPGLTYEAFDETAKQKIIEDIRADFREAEKTIPLLPKNARLAVQTSYRYYTRLLDLLDAAPVEKIKSDRLRLPNSRKLLTLVKARAKKVVRR